MGLKLVLKPGEKVVINQAVIVNAGEKAELVLENPARVLRQKDIMTEGAADSPAKRVYFLMQMLYLFPERERHYQGKFNDHLRDFVRAVPSSTSIVVDMAQHIMQGNYYAALKVCRKLIAYEAEVFARAQ
jgi:flagellar protein FlbT